MVKVLVEYGANINLELPSKPANKSPQDWSESTRYLLRTENAIRKNTYFGGGTALHAAMRAGNWEIIEYLINKGANVNIKDMTSKETPLNIAIQWYKVRKDFRNSQMEQLEKTVKLVMEHGYDIKAEHDEASGPTPICSLRELIKINAPDLVKLLLEKGANPNAVKNSNGNNRHHYPPPLIYAIAHKMPKIAQILIKKGADVNHKNVSQVLPMIRGFTPLHAACQMGPLALVKSLVKAGANLNIKNNLDMTPLHIALGSYTNEISGNMNMNKTKTNQMTKIATLLIENGADLDGIDKNNRTPLSLAAELGNLELVKLLIQKGSKGVNVVDNYKRSPLYFAIKNDSMEMAEIFVGNGANLNQGLEAKYGGSLIHTAIQENSEDIVTLLLDNGVDLSIKNKKGKTALEFAKTFHCQRGQIIEKILRRMIKDKENSAKNSCEGEPKQKKFKFDDCVICFEPRFEMFVLNPCGHAKTCEVCCMKIIHLPEVNTTCPVCRQDVDSYTKAYF